MAMTLDVFTIGGGDLLEKVFNAVAVVFNDPVGVGAITSLAIMFGGLFTTFEFAKSKDIKVLIRWAGMYIIVTSLVLYPKATVVIEDRSGIDIKPRFIDHVPLSLAVFASLTSRIGIGFTEVIETVFHLPDDMSYNKTGMLMGSRLVLASRNFQITDPEFTQTLNEFMQQCVFYDLLLKKYTTQDLIHADNPWDFIKNHTSQARAFPLNSEITVCNVGAAKLDTWWNEIINAAASIYGGQLLGTNNNPSKLLLSHLSDGYSFLTNVSAQGEAILKTNLLANAMSNALSHYGANANAPAALQAYEDTKSELQARETMDQTGRQAAVWMQYFKNIIEAVVYAAFIIIYFLSYFPFGGAIVRNYLTGLFVLQALAPMYAIINFAANLFAQNRSIAFIASDPAHGGLSMANIAGITQANADAMAVAGYLMWPVTLGGAVMLFRGMPNAIQSMGQLLGGVVQHSGSHVVAESVGGNISAGNANFGNRSLNNTTANHWDTNARYAAGAATFQTGTGSSLTITPDGSEVLDNRGGLSNLGVSVHVAESIRSVASHQAQSSLNAAISQSQSAGEQYGAALRKINDYSHQQGHFESSGKSFSSTETTGFSKSAHEVSQLVNSFAKEHHISHEKAAQVLGQVYADMKGGFSLLGNGGSVGVHGSASLSGRSAFGSMYNDAYRFATDHNFAQTVDSAKRQSVESHYRDSNDQGNRLANSIASSFDKGDSYRIEASSQFSKAESYSQLASISTENAASINSNYTQEFYNWMRHQPSPSSQYGQGTWSKSAIDNAAINDPASLQHYADRFVNEKTNDAMRSFEGNNHLSHGEQHINNINHQNNVHIRNHSDNQFQHFNNEINHEIQNRHAGNVGTVNESIKQDVTNHMNENKEKLDRKETELKQQADPLQERIREKVKGQVFGSLNAVKATEKWVSDKLNSEE
jgi:conjugal transfer mating pair stabilization protein TraG